MRIAPYVYTPHMMKLLQLKKIGHRRILSLACSTKVPRVWPFYQIYSHGWTHYKPAGAMEGQLVMKQCCLSLSTQQYAINLTTPKLQSLLTRPYLFPLSFISRLQSHDIENCFVAVFTSPINHTPVFIISSVVLIEEKQETSQMILF